MNEDIITSEEDLSRNKTDNNPVMDNVENSEQTATNPTPKRNPNVFDNLSEFHTYEGQLNEGLQDALDLEKEYYTPQAGWGESTYDKEVRNKYQIEHGDLNDIRAEQQSGIAQITNGIGKSLVLTGTTALDGTIGTLWGFGQGIANAFSDDPNKTFWNGFVNNGFTNSMRDVEQFFDKYMPNYVGTAESKLGGFEAMGTANFWADQIKQIGFTAGTALGATVTGLVTGGSGVLPKLAGNFGKILGMGTKGVNWMERLGLSMMSGFNETKNVVSGNTENRFNEYNRDNFNEYQQKLKDLDDRVINETYKRLYDLGYYKKKPEGIPTVIPRQEVIDQYKALVAKEFQGEYDALKAEYEEKSKDPMQRTVAAGSLELGVGTLFMTAMNMMGQMSVLPSPFTNAERMVNGSFTNKFARAANFITRKNKFSKDAFNEFKNISKGELAVKKLSEGISEMVEEGGQDIVTDFATIYYGSDNLQGSKTAAARAADAFMQSVDKNVNGESMYKDMQGAFLSTLIGTPIINKGASQNGKKDRTFTWQGGVVQMYKDASEEYKKSKETYDFIKDIINSPERRTAFNLNVFANTQKNKMMEAAAAADEKKWRDASDNISLKTIEAFASIGRLSDLKALTKDYENITDEQLEALAIGLSTKGEDGKYASENGATDENGELITNTEEGREKFKQNLIDNANKFNKMIDNYMDNFNSVDKLTGYQLNRDDLSMLTWGLTQADNWDERIKSMSNTIKEKYGVVLDKIIGSLQKELDDKQKYEQELNTLIAQDKENPSEDLKNRIKEVQSLIDPDLDENTYKTVLNVYDKLRNIDLDNTEKIGLWNQFIGDDFNMFTTTRDLLKGFSDDEISQIDKHDFLQLLDDIRKCNNSKHNVTNVVNQLIKNPEEIKRLRDEFIEKEERDIMSDSIDSVLEDLEQTTSETNEEPTISDAESILKELSEKLKDPKQLAKAVTEIANKNNQLKQLFQELEKKLKEKNAIDNIGDNILQNDLLPASINNPENKELIERFIKDFLQYLINEYKDSKKSLYKLNTRDIFSNLKTFLKQLSEQGRNQYMPSSMEMQVIVGKTKQILQQLYNQAVENGDIEKRHGQTTFISDNKGNVYYLTDKNKPSKMNNVFPIKTGNTSIQESKTQSGIERTTEVAIPDNFVEGEIIDVEYEIINSDIEQNDEIIEVEAEVIENDYDENVEFITVNGILAISDNNDNTISVEQQEQIGKEAKDFFENIEQPKPNQLALLEKNQEEEREKIGEELSKIFNQENNSNPSVIEELTNQLNDVLKEKELLEKKSEDLEAKENIPDIIKSLNFAPPSFNPSKPLSNIEKVTKELTEWLQKRLQEQTKKENDLKAEIDKNEATNQKPEIEEVDKGEYPAVLTNISSLEYNYNTSKNTRKAVLNNINEKAMQFFKESGGLEFISSGKLAQLVNSNDKITNVYFKREDGIDGTVFMYVKNGKDYQCIGYLDNAGLQGVLGYNILYPKTQKKNGYYFDHNGIKHKVDISIVDKDGNITPVTSEKYITLKNANGETLSIGQIFNDRVYQTDLDNLRPVSEINVGNNSFKEALSSGNVSIGYATSESCKDLLSDTTLTNVNKSIAPGSIVVIFNTATNTKMAYPVLSNTPISEWSNRESDEYINFMNDELINLAKAINYIGDSKEFYAKLASFFNNFTNKKFNSIKSKSVVLRTYRKEEIGFFPEMDSTKANVFKIDLCNPESNEVLQTIYIDKTELLKGNLPLAMEERAIAKSIYNQLIHPKILKWNRANKTWEWHDSDNIFYFNLNVRHLSNLDEKAKKDYLSAFSNYIVSDARNFKVDGTFTVVFQSASRRVNDINLSSTRSGTTERQRKAKQSISKFPSLRLGNGVEYEIVPDVDEDKNLLNNSFKLKSTSIDETDNIGYLGNILSYRKFVGSILENPRVTDDLDIKDFNIFTNKILSCIYNYLNTNDDAKLPLYAEYKVENNIMSIPEIGVSINLSKLNISGENEIGVIEKQPETAQQESKTGNSETNTLNINAGTGENADLSNIAERPFTLQLFEGEIPLKFNSVEHAFQYVKFRLLSQYLGFEQTKPFLLSNQKLTGEDYKENVTTYIKRGGKVDSIKNGTGLNNIGDSYEEELGYIQNHIKKLLYAKDGWEAKRLGGKNGGYTIAGRSGETFLETIWDYGESVSEDVMKAAIKASFEQNPQALQKLLATGDATLTHKQGKGKWNTDFPKLLMEVRNELRKIKTNVKANDLSNKQSKISFNKENTIRNGTQRKTEERYSGGRANDAITAIIRGSQGTSSKTFGLEETATGESSQDDRNDKQEELIEKWSKGQNIWHEDTDKEFHVKYGEPIAKEGESTVFYDKERGIVVKTKNTLQYHDLLEAIVGVKLHNEKFPEAPITITGFGNDSEGFVIVIEQPFIKEGEYLTQEEINKYVSELDDKFENENIEGLSGRYQNKEIELHDMHEGNAIRTPEGNIIVIDCVIRPKNIEKWLQDNGFYINQSNQTLDKQQTGTKSNEKEVEAEKKIEKKNYTNKKTKRKSIGITKGGSVSVKTGEYNAKTFFSDNIEIFKNRKLDSQLLDFIGKNLSNETKVVVISNKEFDEKYGRTTNGLYKIKEHVVVLRESTDMSTIIHEFAHAVTTDLTAAWLENRDAITGKIDSPISTLTEIYYEISRLYNDNPQVFANTNVEYFLNQSDISSKLDEMIGEIFGDKDLQRILKGYEKSLKESTAEYKPKSIFGLIREFLRKLFRMAGANKVQIEKTINLFDEFKLAVDDLNKISPSNNANNDRFDVNTKETEQEMQSIKDKAIADGTFMKAPNGKPTNLNERQWLQVRTKAFKEWFGDWEKTAPKALKDLFFTNGEINWDYFEKVINDYHNSQPDSMFAKGRTTLATREEKHFTGEKNSLNHTKYVTQSMLKLLEGDFDMDLPFVTIARTSLKNQRELLLLAAMFHDAAKPYRHGDIHGWESADILRDILGANYDNRLAEWAIRHHMPMPFSHKAEFNTSNPEALEVAKNIARDAKRLGIDEDTAINAFVLINAADIINGRDLSVEDNWAKKAQEAGTNRYGKDISVKNVLTIELNEKVDLLRQAFKDIKNEDLGDAKSNYDNQIRFDYTAYPEGGREDKKLPYLNSTSPQVSSVSKVVDENGEPLVVYHGSSESFNTFRLDTKNRGSLTNILKKGFYFSNKSIASQYASSKATEDRYKLLEMEEAGFDFEEMAEAFGFSRYSEEDLDKASEYMWSLENGSADFKDNLYAVFLNIKNPATVDLKGQYIGALNKEQKELINNSEGAIVKNVDETTSKYRGDITIKGMYIGTDYIVFNPNQVKSATDNVGTFSRENDDIRFRIGKKARVEFENKLRKSRPDMSEYEIKETLDFLHKLEDNKENNAFIKTSITWIVNNSITLPEDYEKVRQIFDVARKKNIDTQKYKTFGELMAAPEMQKKEKDKKAFNPDKAKSFSNKQIVKTEGGRVFTVYDVKNTDEGQRDVCHALAAHYETSPWCLSTFTKTGSPTESAKKYWKQYDAIPRKIAFEDGKPVAFSSTKRGSSIESVGNIGPYEIFESSDGKYELDATADLEDVAGLQRAGIITIDNYEDQGIPFSRYILTEKGIERAGIKKKELPNEAWWDMEDRFAQEKLSDNIINKPLDRYVLELQQGPFPQMPTNIHTREEADAWIRENNPEWFNEDVETFQEDNPFFDDISNYMTDEMLDEMYNDFMRAEEERDYNQRQRLFDEYPELEYLSQENIDDFILNEMSNDDSRERLKNILGDEQFERYENLERDKKIDEACRNYNITREEFESQPRERQDLILRCL